MGIERFAFRVSRAPDVAKLVECVLDEVGELLAGPYVGFYLFNESDKIDIHTRNIPSSFVDRYERIGRPHDPVLAALRRAHAPVAMTFEQVIAHSRDPSIPDAYRAFLDDVLVVTGRATYVAAPLVVDGVVAGTINGVRSDGRVFDSRQLLRASALALHVSTRLAALRALERGVDASWRDVLTRRGLEVAELAARGLTTREMGRVLGVSANTVKKHLRIVYERLGIATRAELARALALPATLIETGSDT